MTNDNRVLCRKGARELSGDEMQLVMGGTGTSTTHVTGCFRCAQDINTDSD